MIKLTKRVLPPPLKAKVDSWYSQHMSLLRSGAPVPPSLVANYRDPHLKEEIRRETSDKCAYCESKVSHVYPGDVEHILPKSKVPEKTLVFDNLTYACHACNNLKSDYYDPSCPLIDPYRDDPQDHLIGFGAFVFRRPGSVKGFNTEELLKLNRPALAERRSERIESVKRLADTYARLPPNRVRDAIAEELRKEAAPDREYSLVVQNYISQVCGINP
jgi:hypothetical protein